MKKRSLVIFVAAFIFAMFFRESCAQDAFPLYCRGGGTMKFMAHKGDVQGTYNILGMSFQKAPGPSGKEGKKLAPGQCSWGDRRLNNNEPDILQEKVLAGVSSTQWTKDLRNPGKYWMFIVYNANGVLNVKSALPRHGRTFHIEPEL